MRSFLYVGTSVGLWLMDSGPIGGRELVSVCACVFKEQRAN